MYRPRPKHHPAYSVKVSVFNIPAFNRWWALGFLHFCLVNVWPSAAACNYDLKNKHMDDHVILLLLLCQSMTILFAPTWRDSGASNELFFKMSVLRTLSAVLVKATRTDDEFISKLNIDQHRKPSSQVKWITTPFYYMINYIQYVQLFLSRTWVGLKGVP